MTTFFRSLAERAHKRALFVKTYREISSLSPREADDLGIHPGQAREIAYKAIYS